MSEALEAECMNPTTLENPLQGLSRFRSQSHIAQQSRRDKMRVHQNFTSPHFSQIPNQMLHQPGDPGMMSSELAELRNAKNCDQFKDYTVATTGGLAALYDSTMFPSEMLNFPTGAQVLFDHKEAIPQPHPPAAYSKPIDAQNPSDWKGSNWQQNCEFIMNYVQGPGNSSGYYNQNPLLAPMFVGGLLSGTLKDGNFSSSQLYLMNPNCNGYQDVQSSANNPSSEISSQDSQKQYANPNFPSFQHNTLSEDVTSSTVGSQAIDMGLASQTVREPVNDSWGNGGTELLLLPSYEDQSTVPRLGNIVGWTNGIVDTNQSNQEAFVVETRQTDQLSATNGCDGTVHGLSLSLSSNPPSELHLSQSEDRYQSQELPSRNDSFHGAYDQKAKLEDLLKRQCLRNNLGYFSSNSRCSETVVKCSTIASSSTDLQRNAGPLGPFTGYATILKSSKFLEPAQQLLDEFCSINRELHTKFPNPRLGKEQVKLEMGEGDVSVSCTPVDAPKPDGNTCSSPSLSFNPSGEHDGETRFGSAVCQGYRSEFQRKKAKLLFMLDEVFRRYKQYHHQVQMVISSFESVAGLSSATPYTCSALKVVSKHFRYLKNAISDQIQSIIKSLGKECCSTPGTSTSKGEIQTPRLKMLDQSLQKQKATENLGTFEQQQHVWRPQRGLPERSVAVLRSWLFEHFLHPYPNDADKHILASQTGLSRSQVSNWFINARVRLWKPMVEEIHMLEIKESSEVDLNSVKSNQKQVVEERPTKNLSMEVATSFNGDTTAETSPIQADLNDQLRQRQKRSRMEDCQIPAMVNGGSIGFASYQSGGLEMGGGLGSISLTLGLHTQQQQQQQQQLLQLGKNTSTHFLHDFVG